MPLIGSSPSQGHGLSGSSSVSTPPVHVTLSPVVFHILVLSSGTTYPAEILTGWQTSEACYDNPHPCELTHLNFADDHDLVVILKLLDKVRDGFFQVVLILPPASSWSRARHVGPVGQPPIRSRSRPWEGYRSKFCTVFQTSTRQQNSRNFDLVRGAISTSRETPDSTYLHIPRGLRRSFLDRSSFFVVAARVARLTRYT